MDGVAKSWARPQARRPHLLPKPQLSWDLDLMSRPAAAHRLQMWTIIYEKLFGGFEDLSATIVEDENEIDELDSIPSHKKTSNCYLKDGFIVGGIVR